MRTFLEEKLPDAMIPATFMFLESLPRNPNGKHDRRALARLIEQNLENAANNTYAPPRGRRGTDFVKVPAGEKVFRPPEGVP